MTSSRERHPITGRWLAHDCEIDCLEHCAGLCGAGDEPTVRDALVRTVAKELPGIPVALHLPSDDQSGGTR